MLDVAIRYEALEVESPPAMRSETAKQSEQSIGFVLPVWPELRHLGG